MSLLVNALRGRTRPERRHPRVQRTGQTSPDKNALPAGGRRATPGWLWPHLCSLDAPLVAVVWQHWWAHVAQVELPWQRDAILAAAVWTIYLADRLADVTAGPAADHGTARHAFSREARMVIVRVVPGLILVLAVVTPWWLTGKEFGAGLCLLALAGGYFWTTHRRAGQLRTPRLPKEAAVGALFALGSAAFALCRAGRIPGPLLLGVCLGGALFFLNCALITSWEESLRDLDDPASLLNAFPGVVRRLRAGCLATACVALGLSIASRSDLFLPVAASAMLLWWLDRCRGFLSTDALRVLVDMALLTPGCWLVFFGWLV